MALAAALFPAANATIIQNFIMNEELGTYFGNQLGAIAVTAAALFGFGLAFNWLINLFNRHGLDDGFTWLLVVVGVGITVLAAGFTIGWTAVIVLFIYFAASGLPMAAGDIYRYAKARRAERYDKTA